MNRKGSAMGGLKAGASLAALLAATAAGAATAQTQSSGQAPATGAVVPNPTSVGSTPEQAEP